MGANGAGKSSIISAVMELVSISGRSMRFVEQNPGAMSCGRLREAFPLPAARARRPAGQQSGEVRRGGTAADISGLALAEEYL